MEEQRLRTEFACNSIPLFYGNDDISQCVTTHGLPPMVDGVFSMFSALVVRVPTACTVVRKIKASESFLPMQMHPEVALQPLEAGASASAQIISFKAFADHSPDHLEELLNAYLPSSIRAFGAERVPEAFCASSEVSGLGSQCIVSGVCP